jgi:hypothetical protein
MHRLVWLGLGTVGTSPETFDLQVQGSTESDWAAGQILAAVAAGRRVSLTHILAGDGVSTSFSLTAADGSMLLAAQPISGAYVTPAGLPWTFTRFTVESALGDIQGMALGFSISDCQCGGGCRG